MKLKPLHAALAVCLVVTGCSGPLREHIRERDFRAANSATEARAAASPIADVHEMPGWTTDFESALAFARENGQYTAVFFHAGEAQRVQYAKRAQRAGSIEGQHATVDVAARPDVAAAYGVGQAPAVIVLAPNGGVSRSTSLR